MVKHIHELADWPKFRWDDVALTQRLAAVRHRQGRLIGQLEALGFALRNEASLQALTQDVVKSSEIEGENLDRELVRSSIARRLGIDIGALISTDRIVEGVVDLQLDATRNYQLPLTVERLFGWHSAMFPTGRSGISRINSGQWRDDSNGPMQVVSGPLGHERVHYQAASAAGIEGEIAAFLNWFDGSSPIDPVLKAGIAHLWFVTIHPFDDGNGRIARAIADMALARSEESSRRFYSMSGQIRLERKTYYESLEATQKGDLDITAWLDWFLGCLDRAFVGSQDMLSRVFRKAQFWENNAGASFNDRQRDMLNRLLDEITGNLTSSKWAAIEKCSPDSALRDIGDLVGRGVLRKLNGSGRSTAYALVVTER